jgi:hypothetical protein
MRSLSVSTSGVDGGSPCASWWGHAEDVLAVTFALYALMALEDRRWSRCGWLLGFGIVMQPLVALLLPLFIGATPAGKRMVLAAQSVALSVVLVGGAFIGNPGETFTAVVKQPTPLFPNHPTPWSALAPKLAEGKSGPGGAVTVSHVHSHFVLVEHGHLQTSAIVSGGAPRILDVVFAVLVGLFVWRSPQATLRLMWLATVVLASRCFFEPVMTPYYLAPPLVLALVITSRTNGKKFWAAVVIAVSVSVYSYFHLSAWVWWLPVVGGLSAMLALGFPRTEVPSQRASDPHDLEGIAPLDDLEEQADRSVSLEPVT